MPHRFKGALIGCGFFAQNHLHAWRELPDAEIVAVCDTDLAKAEAAAALLGGARAYSDAAVMLRDEKLDFADIATTTPSHRPLVELAAQHGVSAICQKPFADTLEDAQAMVTACEAAGVKLLVHENFRWQRPFREMARTIDTGALGRLNFARFSFRHGYDNYKNQPYLAEVERFTIMDVGLHLFDLARHFLGDVDSLFCRTQRLNPIVRGEDSFHASLRHTSGAVSICDTSFWTRVHPEPFPQTMAVIEGDLATLELRQDFRLFLHREGAVEEIDAMPEVPAWGGAPWHGIQESVRAIQAHWLDCLRHDKTPAPSGADNLKTLTLALAAYDSAERDAVVRIAEGGWA